MNVMGTIGALTDLANTNSDVWDILTGSSSRKRASEELAALGFKVSEKLIRTWRANAMETAKSSAAVVANYFDIRNPFDYDPKRPIMPVTLTTTTNPVVYSETVSKNSRAPKSRTIVVMPDVQAPLHDQELVQKFIDFLGDFQPDELAQVGDFTDSTEISRWVRGKKGEFAGDLQEGFNASRRILFGIRQAFDGRFRIVRSNHDDRLESYIDSCAPGLAGLAELTIENLAGFNEADVEFVRDEVVELAPGWVMAHGDEGSLSPVAGKTAFGLAKNKFGVSTVCGHTHRAGMTSESTGYNGRIRNTLTGLEVGHFMDLTKADYLKKKGVAANWQQAFGILEVFGERVYPQLITVQDGRFVVDGVEY